MFTTAQDSVGWVRVRATLVYPAPRGDVLLAQRVLEVRQPASAPNAAAGVQALAQGGGCARRRALPEWLQTVSKR